MKHFRLSLVVLLAAVGFASCNDASTTDLPVESLRTEMCDTCLWLVNTTEVYLNDTQTKRTIIDFLNAEICTVLPGDMALQCQTLSTLLVPQVVEYLVNNFPSATVCQDVGVCPLTNGLIDSLGCPLCQYLVNSTVQQALDPRMQDVVKRQAHAACQLLQPNNAGACKGHVDSALTQIDAILKDVNSTATCTELKLCGSNMWGPVFSRIKTLMQLQQTAAVRGAATNDGYCEACQIAVMELAALVADPAMQAQITNAAKSACSVTGQWQSQCNAYIDTYAPVVFNVALMYLKPEQMCQQIMHVCPVAVV